MKRLTILIVDSSLCLLGKGVYLLLYLLGWRFMYVIGRLAGDVIYSLSRGMRETTKEELNLLFGSRFTRERITYITKRSFENYYMRQIETICFGALNKHRIDKIMHVEGIENLNWALSKGKGAIVLLSHVGSFLLPLPFLGYRGYKVNQVTGKDIHASSISKRIWEWRKREANKLPVKYIQVGRFLKPIYEALRNNEIVAVAFDGRDGSRWIPVDFLERKALFSSGPFELARRTGAVIIPTFVIRQEKDCHKLVLGEPFLLSTERHIKKAVSEDVIKFTKVFAKYVERYPCHFGMVLYKVKETELAGQSTPFFVEN